MTAIVQGSNRTGNVTRAFVDHIAGELERRGQTCSIIDIEEMPGSVLHGGMYEANLPHPYLDEVERVLRASERWVIVFPEYNGSMPGALKLLIDALSVREYASLFGGKVAALIGTASGRAGNLRGIDHLTSILNHLGTTVMPQAMPISQIETLLQPNGTLGDGEAEATLQAYLNRFAAYADALASVEDEGR